MSQDKYGKLFASFFYAEENGKFGLGNCGLNVLREPESIEDVIEMQEAIKEKENLREATILGWQWMKQPTPTLQRGIVDDGPFLRELKKSLE